MSCRILSCKSPCYEAPLRRVTAVLVMMALIISYVHRASLNVAIVEMVAKKAVEHTCKSDDSESSEIKKIQGGKKEWSQETQSILLLSFYCTYIFTHFPGGYISDRYGGRYPMLVCMVISSITTCLIPVFVQHLHWGYTVALRVITGAAQGALLPTMTSFLARWVPPSERATLGGLVFAGGSVGSIVGNLSSGLLITYFRSWTVVFYFGAILGVIWIIAALLWLYSGPESHPHILQTETEFLQKNIKKRERRPFPIGKILLDVNVWAMIVAQCGHGYTIFTLLTNLPKYMNEVLNFNMKKNAVASSLPYLGQYISSVLSGCISDYLITHKNANVTMIRVVYVIIGSLIPCAFLVGAAYADCNKIWAMTFISLALFTKGPFFASLKVNGMDLSQYHSGLLMALSNGIGSIGAIISPPIIAKLAPQNTHPQWHLIFWINFIVNVVTTVFYAIFGKAKRAKWDYTPEEWEAFQALPKKKIPWYLQKTPQDFNTDLENKTKAILDAATEDKKKKDENLQILEKEAGAIPDDDKKKKITAEKKVKQARKGAKKAELKVEKLKKKHENLVAKSLA